MRRHDIRLKKFDYRAPGVYLVTVVTAMRVRCLARIVEEKVVLLPFGAIVKHHCGHLSTWRPSVDVVDHVVMPDHVHVLFRFQDEVSTGLGAVVGCWKAGITREVNRIRETPGATFWQHNYWERVVRSELELASLRRYFAENPARWSRKYGPG